MFMIEILYGDVSGIQPMLYNNILEIMEIVSPIKYINTVNYNNTFLNIV